MYIHVIYVPLAPPMGVSAEGVAYPEASFSLDLDQLLLSSVLEHDTTEQSLPSHTSSLSSSPSHTTSRHNIVTFTSTPPTVITTPTTPSQLQPTTSSVQTAVIVYVSLFACAALCVLIIVVVSLLICVVIRKRRIPDVHM